MRRVLALAPALVAACSTAPAAPIVHGQTPGHKCVTEGISQFIGQKKTSAIEAAVKRATHAAVLRWAPPGVMLTMDYREDRVTVWLDPADTITQIKCG